MRARRTLILTVDATINGMEDLSAGTMPRSPWWGLPRLGAAGVLMAAGGVALSIVGFPAGRFGLLLGVLACLPAVFQSWRHPGVVSVLVFGLLFSAWQLMSRWFADGGPYLGNWSMVWVWMTPLAVGLSIRYRWQLVTALHLVCGAVLASVWVTIFCGEQGGTMPHRLANASVIVLAVASLAALVPRWAVLLGFGIALLGVGFTSARIGLMGLLAVILAWMLPSAWGALRQYRLRNCALLLTALMAVMGLVVGVFLWINPERFFAMVRLDDQRWGVWAGAVRLIGELPWFGVGSQSNYADAYVSLNIEPLGMGAYGHAHNIALGLAAEHGLPALGCYIALLAGLVRWCYKSGALTAGCMSLFVAWIVMGQFEHILFFREVHGLFGLLLGLHVAQARLVAQPLHEAGGMSG